jgi:hypothetical protein
MGRAYMVLEIVSIPEFHINEIELIERPQSRPHLWFSELDSQLPSRFKSGIYNTHSSKRIRGGDCQTLSAPPMHKYCRRLETVGSEIAAGEFDVDIARGLVVKRNGENASL